MVTQNKILKCTYVCSYVHKYAENFLPFEHGKNKVALLALENFNELLHTVIYYVFFICKF